MIQKFTFDQFIDFYDAVNIIFLKSQKLGNLGKSRGQIMYNLLYDIDPDWAISLKGTELDPSLNTSNIKPFLKQLTS